MSLDNLSYENFIEIIIEKLNEGKKVRIKPNGTSMMPMLRPGVDEVELTKPVSNLKKYDIPFYKRKNGQYVLHRIIKVRKNDYVLCGDAHFNPEFGITDDMIIAVVSGYIKDGVYYSVNDRNYQKYAKKRVNGRLIRKATNSLRKVFRKICKKRKA